MVSGLLVTLVPCLLFVDRYRALFVVPCYSLKRLP
jgi:hypothetical protein